jgi:hypothetical protein
MNDTLSKTNDEKRRVYGTRFFKGRKMVKVGIDTFLVTVSTKAFAVICSSFALIFEFGILPE